MYLGTVCVGDRNNNVFLMEEHYYNVFEFVFSCKLMSRFRVI